MRSLARLLTAPEGCRNRGFLSCIPPAPSSTNCPTCLPTCISSLARQSNGQGGHYPPCPLVAVSATSGCLRQSRTIIDTLLNQTPLLLTSALYPHSLVVPVSLIAVGRHAPSMTRSWTRCPRPPTHASSFIHQPALFLQPLDVIGRCAPSLTGCCIEQQPNHSLQQPCTQTLSLLLLPPSLQGVAHHH